MCFNFLYLHVGHEKQDATDCQEGDGWEEQAGHSCQEKTEITIYISECV